MTKTVNPASFTLKPGQTGTSTYTVTATETGVASVVAGTVTVPDLAPGVAANIVVTDPGALTCSGSATLTCPYSYAVKAAGTNTALVAYKGGPAGNIETETTSASAPYTFPGTQIDAAPSLSDLFDGDPSLSLAAPAVSGQAYTYSKVFACETNGNRRLVSGESKTYPNTATLATSTPLTASAQVQVSCGDLIASASPNATYLDTFDWTVTKSVDKPTIALGQGQSGTATYTVVATKGAKTISNIVVVGAVNITNLTNANVTVNSVTQTVGGANATISNCTIALPATLAPLASMSCTATTTVPGAVVPATATAVWSTSSGNVSVTTPVTSQAVVQNPTANVSDVFNGGPSVALGTTDVTKTFTYGHDFTCGFDTKGANRIADGATQPFPNVATLTAQTLTKTADALVTVSCQLPVVPPPPPAPTVPATVPPTVLPATTVPAPTLTPTTSAAPATPTVPASVIAQTVPTVPVSVLADQLTQSAPGPAYTGAETNRLAMVGALFIAARLLLLAAAAVDRRRSPGATD